MGSIKAAIVPDNTRTTTYNLFYVPMNILICTVLCWHRLNLRDPYQSIPNDLDGEENVVVWALKTQEKLCICSVILFIGFLCMLRFNFVERAAEKKKAVEGTG